MLMRSVPANDRAAWTPDDNELLCQLYRDSTAASPHGVPDCSAIAEAMGRSRDAIYSQAFRLGLGVASRRSPHAKQRKCLGPCGQPFMSSWSGERICQACKKLQIMRCA